VRCNLFFAWFFLARLDAYLQVQTQLAQLVNAPGATQSVASPVLGTVAFILLMLVPVFTMRLIAERAAQPDPGAADGSSGCELGNRAGEVFRPVFYSCR